MPNGFAAAGPAAARVLPASVRSLVPVLLWLAACASAAPDRLGVGDHDVSVEQGERTRTAWVHVPPAAGEAPLAVVVAYHGGGGNARGYRDYAGLDAVADREGFVVVYPDGTGSGWLGRRLLTWNGGGCCGRAARERVDDVGFTWALLRDLASRVPLDRTRVYATGHSNGAMMAYQLAASSSERVAAIAAVAGAMQVEVASFAPLRPVPVLHVHSVDDPRALYEGGLGPRFPFTNRRVDHRPVAGELLRWVAVNGCGGSPRETEHRMAPAGRADAGHTATRLEWTTCRGAPVVLWKLTGAGHGWPGGDAALSERLVGPDTQVIDAAEEAWAFLAAFSRPEAPPLR